MEKPIYYVSILVYILLWIGLWGLSDIFINYLVNKHKINRTLIYVMLVILCITFIILFNLKDE